MHSIQNSVPGPFCFENLTFVRHMIPEKISGKLSFTWHLIVEKFNSLNKNLSLHLFAECNLPSREAAGSVVVSAMIL